MNERTSPSPPPWDAGVISIFNTALDAVVAIDADGVVLFWNDQAETMFGWGRDEAVGRQLADMVVPESHRSAFLAGLRQYGETGQGRILGQKMELTACRKDREEFPIAFRVVEVELEGRTCFTGFLRDTSERTADARYRRLMAALVDSSYDAIIGRDVAGRVISWNQGAERIYGVTEAETLGGGVENILPEGVQSEEPAILDAMQTGKRLEQFETIRRRKDGRAIHVSVTVSPIADENGLIIGSSSVERDITESKRDKEELRRAKEEAEEASRVRAEFLANVSHELRTPMNAIINMTQISLDEELSDDVRDYLQTANDAAHSLLALLNDILDFSKLESGKFTIEEEVFDLRETVNETVKTLSIRAFQKGLELALEVDAQVPELLIGDSLRLRQVLTNLVGNAIKFTDQGEVVASVTLVRRWPNESRLQFSIRDTGVGISQGDQERIMQPFGQVDASSTRRHGGTGLGLAICGELLQLMGGRLKVESEPGRGSCFSFQLSFALPPSASSGAQSAAALQGLRGMRVLVVDDNRSNRRIIGEALTNWSMRPTMVANGQEALKEIQQAATAKTPYPLIIADALMPRMDGYQLSARIEEAIPSPPPVVLMLSASDRSEFKQREDGSVSVYLQKPVSQSDLMDAVMRALNFQIAGPDQRPETSGPERDSVSLNVLVAEDTSANQRVIRAILEKRGHQVQVAQNGREAVQMLRNDDGIDAILMDVQMPIMDGFQATAAIREQERSSPRSTPIIAMTAHAMRGDREKCLRAGMDAYVSKPIVVEDLLEVLESVVAVEPGDAGQATEPEPAADEHVIDFDGAMKRLAGDMDLFRDFVSFFEEDAPGLIRTLEESVEAGDFEVLARAAHSLKGLAANFGAEKCAQAAFRIEESGKAQRLPSSEMLATLKQETNRLRAALQEYR